MIEGMHNCKDFGGMEAEFEIFANKHRLAILTFLKSKKSRPVGDIADNVNASFKVVSKNLLYLANNGILKRRYDGPFVLYSISPLDHLSKFARLVISYL